MIDLDLIRRWQREAVAVLRILVADAAGSTPREAGAFMLVSHNAQTGTIGGGTLEWECLAQARRILSGAALAQEYRYRLGPEADQCCGGAVTIRYEPVFDLDHELSCLEAEQASWPVVSVFGAGHVGRALAQALSPLPLALRWIDSRADEFGLVPEGVTMSVTQDWEAELALLRPGDGVVIMTPSHTLDALITAAALDRGDLAYVGLIGSRTKRRRFEAGFRALGMAQHRIDALVCPIGHHDGPYRIRDKRPSVIAALVAAELIVKLVHGGQASNGCGST
ncbi:xanthine dehydrogenase accessory protein XdhC [Asaia bogorensis]|uniref:xanthine dehydrogenase accessory protein XdhC n=1 Tax=Asaia bogorensis TaxID=91915 RepID=UPI0009FA7E38|nr:xanthine dehydrogenase accessory protein XdhC [Asaia bogorensis]